LEEEGEGEKSFSWIEIVKHNKYGNYWIVNDGKVYDITKLSEMWITIQKLKTHTGSDCTDICD